MAGVIKAKTSEADRAAPQVAAFNLDDMNVRAQALLDHVRQQAAGLLQQAREEAAEIRRKAEVEARQAAFDAARQAVQADFGREVATVLPALRQAVQAIHEAEIAWRRHWEDYAVKLAVAIAERVVRRELKQTPEISQQWIREALELAGNSGQIRVLIHPQDHAVLQGHTAQLLREMGKLAQAEIVADPSISRGGCRVLTQFGEIDLTLETQLRRIREELAV